MIEKRKFVRITASILIKWKKTEGIPNKTLNSLNIAKNVSRGGICLPMDQKIRVGENLALELRLPTRQIIKIKGKVTYVNDFTEIVDLKRRNNYDVGIEFLEMSKEDRNEFNKFVFNVTKNK